MREEGGCNFGQRVLSKLKWRVCAEIQKKGDWKRPPTPYVKGLTSGEALRVIIALANNYMEKFCIPGF